MSTTENEGCQQMRFLIGMTHFRIAERPGLSKVQTLYEGVLLLQTKEKSCSAALPSLLQQDEFSTLGTFCCHRRTSECPNEAASSVYKLVPSSAKGLRNPNFCESHSLTKFRPTATIVVLLKTPFPHFSPYTFSLPSLHPCPRQNSFT
jgi:hypothetical protein